MEDFDRAILRKVPLAEACLIVLSHVTQEPFLNDLFDRNRGRSYEKVISFPTIVRLVGDALIEHHGSARKSFDLADEKGELTVTPSAVYRKLGRLPLAVSKALVSETHLRVQALLPEPKPSLVPESLRSFSVFVVDGKKIKNVSKRVKVLRDLPGTVLGAKVLVALDLESGLVSALEVDPDGEANDCPSLGGLLEQVRQVNPGPNLFIADRQYCGSIQLDQFMARGDHFLIRRTSTAQFTPDPDEPARRGIDAEGREYIDCRGVLGKQDKARRVRQITLIRPGEESIVLITDLLDEQMYPATDLLDAYLMRWEVERVFQQITEVFSLQRLIGGTPESVVFQCAFCLLLYNAIQVVWRILAWSHELESESISVEQVFYDARAQITTLRVMDVLEKIRAEDLHSASAEETRDKLWALLGGTWSKRWMKAAPKKSKPKGPKPKKTGAHTSILRARQAYELKHKTVKNPGRGKGQ